MRSRLRRHVEIQKDLGVSPGEIAVRLPVEGLNYLRRSRSEGHQLLGYGRFDLPLLASYSRSGTNWIRYIVEWISGQPTPGQVRIHSGADFVIDRAHQAYVNMARYDRVLLVVRDYRECLLRHHDTVWPLFDSVEAFLEADGDFQAPSWYIDNIKAFHQHPGDNLCIHYEDLVDDPIPVIRQLAQFLELPPERTEAFIEDVDTRYARSVNAYTTGGHQSVTTSGPTNHRHHAEATLSDGQAEEFDDFYRTREPELFEIYLARYAVGR